MSRKGLSYVQRLAMLSGLIAAVISAMAGVAAPANASIGHTVYSLPDYQSGYQARNSVGFQAMSAEFNVPDASADGQAGLTGINLTDLSTGREATCGWLGIDGTDGVIGCYDEADTSTGWVTLLPAISPGDYVTVGIRYAKNGKMTVKVADATSGAASQYVFTGPTAETWNEAVIGAIPSTIAPTSANELSSFRYVDLTPVGGTAAALTKGPWSIQPVIVTTDGQPAGQVVAKPTAIRGGNAFSVIQEP